VFARIVSMRLKPNTTAEFTQTIEKKILPIVVPKNLILV
jgi:hypothetical protein